MLDAKAVREAIQTSLEKAIQNSLEEDHQERTAALREIQKRYGDLLERSSK